MSLRLSQNMIIEKIEYMSTLNLLNIMTKHLITTVY